MVLTLFCANFTIIINYDTTDLHKIKPPIFAPGSPFQSNRAGGFIPLPDTAKPPTSRDLWSLDDERSPRAVACKYTCTTACGSSPTQNAPAPVRGIVQRPGHSASWRLLCGYFTL